MGALNFSFNYFKSNFWKNIYKKKKKKKPKSWNENSHEGATKKMKIAMIAEFTELVEAAKCINSKEKNTGEKQRDELGGEKR